MMIPLIAALTCYAIASVCFVLERTGFSEQWVSYGLAALILGAALQTVELGIRAVQAGTIPVTNFSQSLVFLAWLTAWAGLVLMVKYRMQVIGVFVAPLIVVALGVACALAKQGRLVIPHSLRSVWLPIHVTLAFLGDTLFVLAAGVSAVYLVYEKKLKAKRPLGPADQHAPSLEKLDRINYHLLGWGFLMLSLAIISGSIWADATWGHYWSWEPQESWSLVIWLLYAGLLESRLTVGWRGRRAAALTIVVFTVLVGSFIGVTFISPGKHGGNFG